MDGHQYIKVFLVSFIVILTIYYLFPACLSYMFLNKWNREKWLPRKIQPVETGQDSILREIAWSLSTVFIFSILATIGIYWINQGYTKVYFSLQENGLPYFILSILIYIIIHDTYFYWLHRLMHWRPVFRLIHRVHHLSHNPSPFASLSFNPGEAILQFGINLLMIFLIPLHPIAIGIFALYNTMINTAGHTGFELIPPSFSRNPLLKYGLTVSHHDLHHSRTDCNYGLCFVFWDRLMGTENKKESQTSGGTNG